MATVSGKSARSGATRTAAPQADDTRTALLVGAIDAFAECGYQAMSVRALTRKLGVSHNIVHHHFGSKWKLWCAAMEHGLSAGMHEIVQSYDDALHGSDPIEVVRTIIRNAVMLFARYPSLARILANESAQGGERLDFLFERYFQPTIEAFQNLLDRTQRQGMRKLDSRMIILLVVAGVPALFTQAPLAYRIGKLDGNSVATVNRYADTVAELLIGGLAGTPSPGGRISAGS